MDSLLKDFGVTEADTPIVACARMFLMRNPSNERFANKMGHVVGTEWRMKYTICSS